jgi:HK97 family phage prohead protease
MTEINKSNFEKFFFESKVALGIKADESTDASGVIEATVTTWGAREGADGRRFNYKPEGFAQWADEFAKSGKPLPMYFQHNDMSMPVGEWQEFEFTDTGMNAKGRLFTNTTAGKDLYTIMKESPAMVGGVSVGAYADEYCMTDKEGNMLSDDDDMDEAYFQITKGGLREVSIVMQPNNLECNISKLECFRADGSLDLKLIEKALRDAKLSRKDATTASSIFKQILETRDEPKVEVENTPIQSESDAVVNEEDQLLKAFEERELLKQLNNRLKG